MIGALIRLLGGTPQVPAAPHAAERERVRARIAELREREHRDPDAPYQCRACGHTTHHPQCWKCGGRCWARRTGMHETDVMERRRG